MSAKNFLAGLAFVCIAALSAALSYQLISPPQTGNAQKAGDKLAVSPQTQMSRPPSSQEASQEASREATTEKTALAEPSATQERVINGAEFSAATNDDAPPERAAAREPETGAAAPLPTASDAAAARQQRGGQTSSDPAEALW